MKEIFLALRTLLKTIPELRWIDLEKGQMNTTRPSLVFPAALITVTVPRKENLLKNLQACDGAVTVRLCFDFTGKTNSAMQDEELEKSLAYFDLVETVNKNLQGFETANFNTLKGINTLDEQRPDGYKVVQLNYTTSFREDTSN